MGLKGKQAGGQGRAFDGAFLQMERCAHMETNASVISFLVGLAVGAGPLLWLGRRRIIRLHLRIFFLRFLKIPFQSLYFRFERRILRFQIKRENAKLRRLTLLAQRNQKRFNRGGLGAPGYKGINLIDKGGKGHGASDIMAISSSRQGETADGDFMGNQCLGPDYLTAQILNNELSGVRFESVASVGDSKPENQPTSNTAQEANGSLRRLSEQDRRLILFPSSVRSEAHDRAMWLHRSGIGQAIAALVRAFSGRRRGWNNRRTANQAQRCSSPPIPSKDQYIVPRCYTVQELLAELNQSNPDIVRIRNSGGQESSSHSRLGA